MKTAIARQNVEFDVLAEVPNSIALLCPKERLEFWKFAAREVSNLRTPRGTFNAASLYDGLCAAVQENERKTPPKSGVNGIPRAVRRLSADELQKAVARHREKLLVNTGARRFLRDVFSRWVGTQKLDTLLSILDAFGLEHDEVGILTVPLREIDTEEATNTLLVLREKLSSYELAVVCAGLMFNQSGWMPLLNAYLELCKAALSEQNTPVASASNVSEATVPGGEGESNLASEVTNIVPGDLTVGPHARAHAADFSMNELQALRGSMNALASKLENAALLLGAGTYVDDDDIRIHWANVATQLGHACEAIGRRTDQVAELEALMLERERTSAAALAAKSSLSRATRVFHIADAAFTGCDEAKLFAEQLLAGSTTALAQEARVEALDALLKLVEPQDVLGDDEAAELGEKVKSEFGRSLATAALRGNLAIRAFKNAKTLPAPSEDAHDEVSPMPPDISVDVASTAKLDSQAGESSSLTALDRVAGHLDAASNFEEQPGASTEDVSSHQKRTIDEEVDAASPSFNPVVEERQDLTEPQVGATASPGESVVAEPVISTFPSPIESGSTSFEPLIAFGDFKRAYWIGSNGRVVPAPWRSGGFYEGVARGALDAWRKGHFELALLRASTVADSDGTTTTLRLDDLRAASRLLDDPADTAVARDRTRSEYMRAALENVPPDRTLALALTLEALCPTFPFIFSTGEVAKLVSAAEFSTPALATVVEFLLNGWSAAADPLDVLRSHIEQQGAADPIALQAALIAAQKKLKSTSASLWSAAGGRLQQTHCRRAWTDFIESQVAPMRDMLIPLNQSGAAGNWSVQAARQRAEELVRSFARIMDSAGVRHQDRAAAIGAAEQIVAAIEDVINAKQRLVRAPRLPAATFGAMPVDQASQLLTDLPSDPLDRLGCRLFRAVIRRLAEANPFVVNAGALVTFPDLAAWVNAELLSSPQLAKGIPIASFSSLAAASAILDAAEFEVFLNMPNDRAQLIADIRNVAVDADRSDILAALSPTDGLQANERTLLHRRALELGDRAYQQARRLEQAWAACDELLAPEAPRFRSLVDEALGVCSSNASETQVATSILLLHWLHEAVAATERARDEVAETRARQAHERSDEIGAEFKRLADSKNYRGAMALLNPDTSVSDHPTEMPRRTIWRKTAMERYSQPRSALIKDLRGVTEDQHLLISWWAQGDSNDSTYRDTLRRALYAVISGEAGRTQAENQRRFPVKLTELREHKERRTVISGSAIRDYFKHAKLNPSFLPQLADYPQIVLTTLLGSPQGKRPAKSC